MTIHFSNTLFSSVPADAHNNVRHKAAQLLITRKLGDRQINIKEAFGLLRCFFVD